MSKGFTYTLEIDAEISDLVKKLELVKNGMQAAMEGGKAPGAEKIFAKIEKAIQHVQEKTQQPIVSLSQFEAIKRETDGIEVQFKQLGSTVEKLTSMDTEDLKDLIPQATKTQIEDARAALDRYAKAVAAAEQESVELTAAKKELAKAERELATKSGKVADQERLIAASKQEVDEIKKKKQALEDYLKAKKEQGSIDANTQANARSVDADIDSKNIDDLEASIQKLNVELQNGEKAQRQYEQSLSRLKTEETATQTKVDELKKSVQDQQLAFNRSSGAIKGQAYRTLRTEMEGLGISVDDVVNKTDKAEIKIDKLTTEINDLEHGAVEPVKTELQELKTNMDQAGEAARQTGDKMNTCGREVQELDQKVKSGEAFAQRLKQFVGLEGGIQIARRAMQRAMQTIQELDKVMTEMAVVTDLEIGDYWNQLADHTKRANELGLAIKDIYEAETLYYQQGLKTEQVMAMSNETLKMGRIAGLSAAEATDKMTAALRGFNMELNETSAQRVADVYSELAAITASDVNEISEAMTKTASIASSAGMEFETTAAFLSQIIETTRESAETAGTAMKTVIARFQELKKDPSEIGEVDGEIIDANQIETALRSVGVALRDASGQFRSLDEVFLELSSKWDGLDTNTQRYIATIAAGSRQQSRFIAMMQDYNRTQELVGAANNSAGASNEQFEKTLDSLETKLNQLKNAWDTFVMGIMDSTMLKVGLSILTAILGAINDLIAIFDKVGLGGAASLALVIAALYLGAKAIDAFSLGLKQTGSITKAFGFTIKSAFGGIRKAVASFGNTHAKTMAKSEAAQKSYSQQMKNSQNIIKKRNKAEAEGTLTARGRAGAEKKLAATYQAQVTAMTEYGVALGFNNAQIASATTLAGVATSTDMAYKAVLGGLTTEKFKELTATMIANGMSEEEIKTRQQAIIATYAQTGAEEFENKTAKKGLLFKLKNYAALLFGNAAKRKAAMSSLGLAGAEKAQSGATVGATGAQWSLNAAMYACPLGWIAAAIVAVIAALALLIVLFSKTSDAAKMEALQQQEKNLNEQLETTKQLTEDLYTKWEEYTSVQKTLDGLVVGTKEWNEKLIEANNQVIELIKAYPKLNRYLKSENGRLTIDEAGYEQIVKEMQQSVSNLNLAKQRNYVMQEQLNINSRADDLYENSGLLTNEKLQGRMAQAGIKGSVGGMHGLLGPILAPIRKKAMTAISEKTEEMGFGGDILNALASTLLGGGVLTNISHLVTGSIGRAIESKGEARLQDFAYEAQQRGITLEDTDKEELSALYKEIFNTEMTDDFYKAMQQNEDAFYDLAASIDGVKRQQEAYADSLMQSAAEMANVTGEWSNTAIALGRTTLNGEEAQQRLTEEAKAIKGETSKKMALQQYAELMGYGYKNGKLYSSQSEMTSDTKIDVDMDLVYESLAENKIKQDEGKELIQIERALNTVATKLDKEERAQLKRIASGNANELTRADLKLVEELGGIKEYLKDIGMDQETIDSLNIDYQEINEEISKGVIDAEKRNTKFKETLNITPGSTEEANLNKVLQGTSLGQANNIQSQVTSLQETYGGDIGKNLLDVIASFEDENLQELLNQQLGAITDWSDAEQITGLSEAMKTFGDITREDEIAINALEDTLITVAMATRKIDVAALKTFVTTLSKTTEEIKKGNRNIDTDTYEALKKSGMDMSMFAETAEGFRYLGDAADFVRQSSVTAYDQMSSAKENFNSLLGRTESSITNLEKAYESFGTAQQDIQEDTRSSWQKLQDWFGHYINKIKNALKSVFNFIGGLLKSAIETLGGFIGWVWDGVTWLFNKLSEGFEWLVEGLGNLIIGLINGIIDLINKLGFDIKKIDEIQIEAPKLKSTAEIQQEKELAESIETLRNNLSELAQGAETYASALLSSADTIESGAILESREEVEAKKKELEAERDQKKKQYGSNWTTELDDSYTEALKALDKVLSAADTALISKAYGYEDLAPVAKEFQYAMESGDESAIELYRHQVANALNLKQATDTMVNGFDKLKSKIDIIDKIGLSSKEAAQYLRQMSFSMGFSNIEEGASFVKENFDLIKNAINGNIESMQLLQKRMLSYLGIDPTSSTLDEGLRELYSNSNQRGQDVLNSLLDSGMFHLEAAIATAESQVMDISYDENGTPTFSGTKTAQKGEQYYTLTAANSSQLTDVANLLGTLEDYESAYDWLYMLNQDLEESIRKREKLEKKYNAILEEENTSYIGLLNARKAYLKSLEDEKDNQQKIIKARKEDQNSLIQELSNDVLYEDLLDYLIFEKDSNGNKTGRVTVSDDYLNANFSSETKKLYDEYIDKFVENSKAIDEARDSIEEIDDTLKEEQIKGKEETEALYDRVKEALINDKQEQIDALNEINDSINSAQESLINKIQEQIDDVRQARENEEKEQDIADKEARLAYLMRDSSGENALEIASLQKEISDAKQEYSDTLIDQSIEKLQDANEKAAEQRERQISLAESQLKAYESSTEIWNDAAAIVTSSLEQLKDGVKIEDTSLGNLLYKWEVVKENLNPFAEEAWFEKLIDAGSLAAIYGRAIQKTLKPSLLSNTLPYKTGGLADFTGPAWLDGTKSKPELVLNQQDTANFIILKDILSEILNGTSGLSKSKEEKTGDNYFDIDISVDSIGEDYDVEQLADKIRSMIYEDASYRNVNTINNLR